MAKKLAEMRNVLDLFSLKGKTAVVTGAASGIGAAIAVAFAEAGADVVGTWHNKPIDETKAAVEATGQKFLGVKIDIGDLKKLPSLIDDTVNAFGKIDIFVNNAAIVDYMSPEERPYESYEKTINVNLNAAYILGREACLRMKKLGIPGRLINVSSCSGLNAGAPGQTAYTISKHGMGGMTMAFAFEFGKYGITVNEICPGYIDTPIHDGTVFDMKKDPKPMQEALKTLVPLGRAGDPEDFKGIAVFMASDASAYTTGVRIHIEGGLLLT